VTLDPTQFQQLLATINALHGGDGGWRQWTPVLAVPVSAFFAMLVGIRLEMYKTSREQKKRVHEKLEKEVSQLNIAIIGIAYNIETLVHIVFQNILPHYRQSHAAYNTLHQVKGDSNKLTEFFRTLHKYPALMMTSPEIYFVEVDFFREMPFIAEKDPNLVKDAGWIVGRTKEMYSTMHDRNKYIETARGGAFGQGGGLNFWQLDSILQTMTSIANKECMISLEFFEVFLRIGQQLETLNETYKIDAKKSKLIPPKPLADAMQQLREIAEPLKNAMQELAKG
jgi:hypothetical protein